MAAWRACRDDALAEAIERVSAMVKRRPPDSAHGPPKISKLCERLDAVPPDRLTTFRYLAKPDRKRLDASLARQRRLTVADLR